MQRRSVGWPALIAALVLLSSCVASCQKRDGRSDRLEIQKFEYKYYGGGKTALFGEIAKERFHIKCGSSYPIDYNRNGTTPPGTWGLVEWLWEYGEKPRSDEHGSFTVKFTFANGDIEERALSVDRYHLILFQMVDDCTASLLPQKETPPEPPTSMDF